MPCPPSPIRKFRVKLDFISKPMVQATDHPIKFEIILEKRSELVAPDSSDAVMRFAVSPR